MAVEGAYGETEDEVQSLGYYPWQSWKECSYMVFDIAQ